MLIDCAGGSYLLALGDVCQLDAVVVVVEPYPRSAEVARRLLRTIVDADCSSPGRAIVVANKIGSDEDLDAVRRLLPDAEVAITVPLDESVTNADVEGRALIDVAPSGPATEAIKGLASILVAGGVRSAGPRGI